MEARRAAELDAPGRTRAWRSRYAGAYHGTGVAQGATGPRASAAPTPKTASIGDPHSSCRDWPERLVEKRL